ncbi:heavy metal translocating P-type ATPase [Ignavigranum ruoffiae]|uniref:heavy metal translocating P-type ATPase n=1 Tax=Ignavigranum ruoffiae TaxID=89093 RepID=UPI0023557B8E|nr:heavy metal translocating P-type ATPase [Ignavigranum ruoffiae]
MQSIKSWVKENKEMTLTIISGLLIIIGFILKYSQTNDTSVPIFILAFLIGGYNSAKNAYLELVQDYHLSVDVLMILAAVGACIIGYWTEGALLIFIFSLSESLEVMAMAKSRDAITKLMKMTPDTARKYNNDGQIIEVPTNELKIGDKVQVRKGESVPIDGKLLSKHAVINEASITGEPVPVTKETGDDVIGATINEEETFDMEVSVENEDTLFSKIIKMVEEAQNSPSKTDSFIKGIEDNYVKIVLIAVPLFIILAPSIFGWTLSEAFYRGMVLLTVASPCALVASAAPTNLSAISRAAKKEIIFKGADTVEQLTDLKAIIFDKTGTLTIGKPEVHEVFYEEAADRQAVNQVIKAAENGSTHPIATAILDHLEDTPLIQLDDVKDITGKGLEVQAFNQSWKIGSRNFVIDNLTEKIGQESLAKIDELQTQGATVIYVSANNQLLAYFALMDELKAESKSAIDELHKLGIQTVMLTGDQEKTAKYIAKELGIDEVRANLLPQDKVSHVKELQEKYNSVAMVGDGINDAPALATANVGISMASGTDIAMETSDIVLIKDSLDQLPFAIGLSHKMHQITKQNIIFSLSVIVLLIISNLFQAINLPIGVVGHEGSTILVILNGLRMLAYNYQNKA